MKNSATQVDPDLPPWWRTAWERVQSARKQKRLPHALLITGVPGVGRAAFATQLARALLCEQPRQDGRACGQCAACALGAAGSHPDWHEVVPEEDSKVLKVDQIRAACMELALTSHRGGVKITIINPAERMNPSAANSLLKTLEEPTDNTLLVLIAVQRVQLAATIRSRCQELPLPIPDTASALAWLDQQAPREDWAALLQLAQGAPLRALALAEQDPLPQRRECLEQLCALRKGAMNPVAVASNWFNADLDQRMAWTTGWIMDAIRCKAAGAAAIQDREALALTGNLADELDWRSLYTLHDRYLRARELLETTINRQLLAEDQLIALARAGK